MQQYLTLLTDILSKGTVKPAAREDMPGTKSLFGYQFRHNLQDGFPLLTTKKMHWKGVVVELLWFLRGDTNIKYLVDHGVNIWNNDAYNYYVRLCRKENIGTVGFDLFIESIRQAKDVPELKYDFEKHSFLEIFPLPKGYVLGDLGNQYGKVWRRWEYDDDWKSCTIDQIANVIKSLKETPDSRRHIVTAIDPVHDRPDQVALYWCHAMFQFNCRRIEYFEGDGICYGEQGKYYRWVVKPTIHNHGDYRWEPIDATSKEEIIADNVKYPVYYLDCQLYQRSADAFLGVPFNIASYALLTIIIAKICKMVPGEFIHTFGDVHIYENHAEAVETQLTRKPLQLPSLAIRDLDWEDVVAKNFTTLIPDDFKIVEYQSYEKILAPLSTGK